MGHSKLPVAILLLRTFHLHSIQRRYSYYIPCVEYRYCNVLSTFITSQQQRWNSGKLEQFDSARFFGMYSRDQRFWIERSGGAQDIRYFAKPSRVDPFRFVQRYGYYRFTLDVLVGGT